MNKKNYLFIQKLLDMEIDEIYEELGRQLQKQSAFPLSRKELIRFGKSWVHSRRSELTEIICESNEIKKLVVSKAKIQNRITLITAIIDLISSLISGIAATTIAVLIVKEGVYSLCEDYWDFKDIQ